jgi:hypothetical protein
MKRITIVAAILIALVAASSGTASSSPHRHVAGRSLDLSRALFEGRWIDLRGGWGSATACLVYPHRPTECFRTTAALLQRRSALPSPDISCSSPLKLHEKTNQLGTTIFVYTRGLWINLSTVDFDNMTSSYTVGACGIELAALANGGGSHYTRCLSAWCVEDVMLTGWDNVISSVYLH